MLINHFNDLVYLQVGLLDGLLIFLDGWSARFGGWLYPGSKCSS